MISPRRCERNGFSLVELMAATVVFMLTMAVLFRLAATGQRVARAQPDAADVHQRLRVAAAALQRDLQSAGSGMMHGMQAGSLANYFPPIVPARTGARLPDPEGSWFSDRLSLLYVPAGSWQARLAMDMAGHETLPVDASSSGCPSAGWCGFLEGTRAVIADVTTVGAGYDLFTVTGTAGGLQHGSPNPPLSRLYTAGGTIVSPVVHRVYYLDRGGRRLMVYDGYQSDLPLVDNVVALEFTYFGDPRPESVARPTDAEGNCVYAAGSPPVPLLSGAGGTRLVPLTAAQLTDGPLCGVPPYRFDGDLLRIRQVRVRLRVQAAADALRGGGSRFANAGRSVTSDTTVPDFEVTFDVAPRNMEARR